MLYDTQANGKRRRQEIATERRRTKKEKTAREREKDRA